MCDRDEQHRMTATNVQEPLSIVGSVLRALLFVPLLNSLQHSEEIQGTEILDRSGISQRQKSIPCGSNPKSMFPTLSTTLYLTFVA